MVYVMRREDSKAVSTTMELSVDGEDHRSG